MVDPSFWNDVHQQNERLWLTDSNPSLVLKYHRLQGIAGKRVLDLGVGMGGMHKLLRSKGCDVWSTDISPCAAHKVEAFLDLESAQKADPFDYVISHLVAQHMTSAQLRSFIPPLKADGVYSIQFAELIKSNPVYEDWISKDLLFFRTEQDMRVAGESMGFRVDIFPVRSWTHKGAEVQWMIARMLP